MSKWMAEIDQRTRLAGANNMELLMFHVGTEEIFGINVFKIREVMKIPPVTKIPDSDERILGVVNLRGENIPLVDLKQAIGLGTLDPNGAKLIITEYNDSKQGFLVSGVDRIIRMSWDRVQMPPAIIRTTRQGAVTAVTKLDDGRMVLILDVEKVLAEISNVSDEEMFAGIVPIPALQGKKVLVADDSAVARKQITKTLDRLGMTYEEVATGKEGWERINRLAVVAQEQKKNISEVIDLVLTDIEMPEMDGFTFTKNLRADPRFAQIPVLMHSSLSGVCNQEKGKAVGVTDYVTKFNAKHLQEMIQKYT